MATYEENLAQMSQPYEFAPLPIRGGGQDRAFTGLLGNIFGGGGATGLEEYLTAAQTEQMNRQALLQAAIAASQASAPSTTPRSFMQILGAGLAGGQQGYQQAQQGALTQLLTKQKLDEYRRQIADEKAYKDMFAQAPAAGGAITPMQAAALPGMALGPTNERAAMINQPMPAGMQATMPAQGDLSSLTQTQRNLLRSMPAKEGRAELLKMLQPPEVVGEPYRSTDGKFYQRTKTGGRIEVPAEQAPAAKPIGSPREVTDAAGKAVLAQSYDDGSIKAVEGFGVPRELVQVNLNNKIIFVDKNKMPANATYLVGMSPAQEAQLKLDQANLGIALKRLKISQAEFDRGNYDRVETADGFAYVPKVPGLPTIPITGPSGEQLVGKSSFTEDQGKSAGFALRMNDSTKLFNQLVIDPMTEKPLIDANGKTVTLEQAFGAPNRYQAIMRSIPSAGLTTGIASFSETSGRQQYRQAQENWVSANLRAESGAVLGTEEIDKEIKKYFPQVDDKPEVIKQKAQARKNTELAMEVRGGPALKTIKKAQQAQTTGGGRLVTDPATGMTRYVEGGN
jgi:hypothetical protein